MKREGERIEVEDNIINDLQKRAVMVQATGLSSIFSNRTNFDQVIGENETILRTLGFRYPGYLIN